MSHSKRLFERGDELWKTETVVDDEIPTFHKGAERRRGSQLEDSFRRSAKGFDARDQEDKEIVSTAPIARDTGLKDHRHLITIQRLVEGKEERRLDKLESFADSSFFPCRKIDQHPARRLCRRL